MARNYPATRLGRTGRRLYKGKEYYARGQFSSRSQADAVANRLRRGGRLARVSKIYYGKYAGDYKVWATD